jgi:secondary thiamine-phosphate synthase enzyme
MKTIQVNSRQQVQMIDITREVRKAVSDLKLQEGMVLVYTPHTTAAITINENADPDVCRDMVMEINKIVPMQDGYHHLEGNSAAHIKSSLYGASEQLIVDGGALVLGTWQGIYFCEFDGPRQRKVHIKGIGR